MTASEYFGELNPRTAAMRRRMLETRPAVCAERAVLATESYRAHEPEQIVLKRAYMLGDVLRGMSIYMDRDALIAGNHASSDRAAPVFPEYAMDWVVDELDEFDGRDGDRFTISDGAKRALRDIYPYWKGRTLKDKGYASFPEHSRLFYDLGIIKIEGNITSGDGHIAVNYERALREGLCGARDRVRHAESELDLSDFGDLKKSYLYRAMRIVIDAVEAFALRHAELAESLAAELPDTPAFSQPARDGVPDIPHTASDMKIVGDGVPDVPHTASDMKIVGDGVPDVPHQEPVSRDKIRRDELLEIARICRKVPMQPAESFHEAVQGVWMLHVILQIESNGHSLSYGRFDQYMYPYYMHSKARGIPDEFACELLENLWLRTFSISKIRSKTHTRFSAGGPLYQNVTIGGQTPDGKDAVNELSRLTLRTVARCRLPQPNLTVRYHRGMDDGFMDECVQAIRCGFGMPAFNNDEVIIPSLTGLGVKREDAYNYSAIGCVEVAVPGKWGYRSTGMSFLNFPKTLMIALNDGADIDSGIRLREGMGHFIEMGDFGGVMRAWDAFVRDFCRQAVILDACADMTLEREVPDILCSAMTEDCIARGKHIKEGGAVYDFISDLQVGVANLGDSLAAIKKCVYEDKSVTRAELWDALLADFSNPGGERVRKLLLAAPKYGNDDDYVDALLVEGYDSYIDEIAKYKNTRYGRGPVGGTYFAGTSSISANVPQGASTCATPDGRRAGEPLAEGCSPARGADKNGPTGVFKSIAKLRTEKITGGVLLNQKIAPAALEAPGGRARLAALLRTFFNDLRGFHVQYNVVSRATLLDAQANPDKYTDLIVRVAGYSAFFNVLSKRTQDDIIARTEQTL